MTNVQITHLVAACAGVLAVAAFVLWVLVPAVRAYSRVWERVAAAVLSLYVLAALVGGGVLAGAGVALWVWPRVFGSAALEAVGEPSGASAADGRPRPPNGPARRRDAPCHRSARRSTPIATAGAWTGVSGLDPT